MQRDRVIFDSLEEIKMSISRKSSTWLGGGILALLLAMPCATAQDKLRLTVANGNPPTIPSTWWMTDYIGPKLTEYTNGRIAVNMQVNSTLCNEHKCVEQAKLGQIDIGQISGGNIGAFGTAMDILNLPYIFKDDQSAEKLINGWLGEELTKRAATEMGLHLIAIIPSYSFRNIDNSKREIKVPADTKGLKFRVTKSPAEFNMIKAWGGIAVPYDWGQLYDGLQSGVVDGMYIPDAYVAAMKFYEVTKFITQTGGSWNAHIFFMDKKRYDKLPDWGRQAIDRIGSEIRQKSFQVDAEWMARQTEALKGKVKIYQPTPAELQQWYAGAPAAWVAVKGTYDPALAKRVLKDQGQDELIKKLEAVGAL
jgi:tripartite ATP-independent transporter DctP family solute receptor